MPIIAEPYLTWDLRVAVGVVRRAMMLVLCLQAARGLVSAQENRTGGVAGIVRLEADGSPVPGARVLLLGVRRLATTD